MSSAVPRSATVRKTRRVPLEWPADRDFRILSIDGGGIRGIFPAAFLAALEDRYLNGSSISQYFDLITGTSTGGVIAIGIGAGLPAKEIRDIYIERGREIFQSKYVLSRWMMTIKRLFYRGYNIEALKGILYEHLGDMKLGESYNRLCIPSCDGKFGDLCVFKSPYHPDFCMDGSRAMVDVAAATSAAPTYFQPLEHGGFTLFDGGVWSNNPIMVGLVDALSCFDVQRERVRILSIGCGSTTYRVKVWKRWLGGVMAWHDIIEGMMYFQSLSAVGQAGLLLGRNRITRVDASLGGRSIAPDDWGRARAELLPAANAAIDEHGDAVASLFLHSRAAPYKPLHGFQPRIR